MRYCLRALLILIAVLPPLLAVAWYAPLVALGVPAYTMYWLACGLVW